MDMEVVWADRGCPLDLEPGTYQFKYVVDGEWVPCPKSARIDNEHGTENSVVVVEEEPA